MGLFSKKTPEERQAEMERERVELEKQRKELMRKKALKKGKPLPKELEDETSKEENEEQDNSSKGLVRVNVNKLRKSSINKANESKASFIKRINSYQVEELPQKQVQKEIISRLQKKDLKKIIDLINNSEDLYNFYEKVTKDFDSEVLVSLGIISKSEAELFEYIKKNNLGHELYQGQIELFNKAYIENQKEKYNIFADDHQKLLQSIKSGRLQDQDNRIKNMPIIYVLGNDSEFNLINSMSLPTKVIPIFTLDDLEIFKNDDRKKCIIMMKHPNPDLSHDFKEIRSKEDFRIYFSFKMSSISSRDEIVPFNRNNIINKFM